MSSMEVDEVDAAVKEKTSSVASADLVGLSVQERLAWEAQLTPEERVMTKKWMEEVRSCAGGTPAYKAKMAMTTTTGNSNRSQCLGRMYELIESVLESLPVCQVH